MLGMDRVNCPERNWRDVAERIGVVAVTLGKVGKALFGCAIGER